MQILLLIIALMGSFFGLTFANLGGAQSQARDTERKNDINSMFAKLEEHYNQYGEYPTVDEVVFEYYTAFPGLDVETLTDPNGNFIQQGDYTYITDTGTALGCQHYELSAHLEDGTKYTKRSLN